MRIGIVGVGLIGGSLGLALRRVDRSIEVIGLTRSADAAADAEQAGAVSQASTDPSVLAGSDVVVVATPIDQIPAVLAQIGDLAIGGTAITDVASVKGPLREWVRRFAEPALFLGGHPLAGKAESGLRAADPAIFKDEPWIFTPLEGQSLRPFEAWIELVRAIGGRPAFLSPEEHDRQIAYLSHLAFTVSSAFAQTIAEHADPGLGGPGYRGLVRLAHGDSVMYEAIVRQNREPILGAIDQFTSTLRQYRDRIERQERLRELFEVETNVAV